MENKVKAPGLSALNLTTTYPPDGTMVVSFAGGLTVLRPGTFPPSHEGLVQVGLTQRVGSLDRQLMSGFTFPLYDEHMRKI